MKETYKRKATGIGSFIIIYCFIGMGVIIGLLTAGLNPTLVISVVSAPIWIAVIFLSQAINKRVIKEEDYEND
jgi:hypothetical protein